MRNLAATRGWILLLSVAFLGSLTALPPTLAQLDPGRIGILVDISASADEKVITKSKGNAAFTFTVTLRCGSGTGEPEPCAAPVDSRDVQITIDETEAPYPGGWTVAVDRKTFTMKPSETKTVNARITLQRDDPEDDQLSVALRATAKPVVNGLLDPVSPAQSQDTASVGVEKRISAAENIVGFARDYMWPLLGAAAVLIVGAVVLAERRRGHAGGLQLTSEARTQEVAPGRSASFPVRIHNESKDEDRVQLSLTSLPPGWTPILPLTELDLRPGESTQLWVTVRAPPQASAGLSIPFEVRARSGTSSRRDAVVPLQCTVTGGAWPESQPFDLPKPPPLVDLEEEAPAQPKKRLRVRR